MPKLIYTLDGQEHTVEVKDSCSIGRTDQNDIALESEAGASRRHVQIMKLAKSFEMTDLGSTNGTKVNGKTAQRHRLAHGDTICIGETNLVWRERDDDDEIDLEEEISLDGDAPKKRGTAGAQSYLVYAGGPNDGQRIMLDKPRVTFGRRSSNTIVIESAAVSGYHCEITREGSSYVLRDLGSTNGTMLDGDPVGESSLQHGGRLGIGDQRLVFVDPSISDFEKAMASVDDLGSEWGMLRAEMDMSRVQKARRSQAVAVVAVFAMIAAMGYVFIANPDLFREPGPTIDERDGNQVPDFSFESLQAGWTAAAGSPVSGGFGEGKDAAQGTSYYTVSRDGASGRAAVVELTAKDGKEFTVRPNQAYEFGAQVRTKDGGEAAVRILWIGAGEGSVGTRISSTGLTSASSWAETSTTAVPPLNASRARLQLVNAGGGVAEFDDVFFLEASDASKPATAADGGLDISASPSGAITIRRGADELVADLNVVGGVLGGGADRGAIPERAGTVTLRSAAGKGGAVRLTGTVLDPYTLESGDFEITLTLSEGRYIDIEGTLPPTAGLVGIIPSTIMDKTVGIWTQGGSFRESQTRFVQGAARVSIGSMKRFDVSGENQGGFRFALLFDQAEHGLVFGSADGTVKLRFDTDSAKLKEGTDAMREAAEAAESQGRIGEAIRLFEAYASEFAAGDSKQDAARRRATGLREEGAARLAALEANVEGAIAYGETAALLAASAEAAAIFARYELDQAEQVRVKVGEVLAARATGIAEVAAAPHMAMAQDHAEGGRKRLATALYSDVTVRFPGTQAASDAQKALNEMGQ